MKTLSLSMFVTAIVYCCSLLPSLAQTVPGQSQSPTSSTDTDTSFLTKAIEANAAEVELGKMAESKSENPRVRKFAQMMAKDHTSALDALRRLATAGMPANPSEGTGTETAQLPTNIPLSKEHEELRNRLSRLSGDDFDREYMNAMIQEHRKDIREFEKEANSANDSYRRQKPQAVAGNTSMVTQEMIMARDLLPILKVHLQHAEALEREIGVTGIPNNAFGGEQRGAHITTQ